MRAESKSREGTFILAERLESYEMKPLRSTEVGSLTQITAYGAYAVSLEEFDEMLRDQSTTHLINKAIITQGLGETLQISLCFDDELDNREPEYKEFVVSSDCNARQVIQLLLDNNTSRLSIDRLCLNSFSLKKLEMAESRNAVDLPF